MKVVRLEQNYRSTKRILRVADQLIAHNQQRKEKTLFTDNPEGQPVRLVVFPTGRDEADAIAGQNRQRGGGADCGGRATTRSSIAPTPCRGPSNGRLTSVSVPYQIVRGLEFYQRKEIKDILAYLHLLNNPANDVAFLRVINTPPRRIGKTTVLRIAQARPRPSGACACWTPPAKPA